MGEKEDGPLFVRKGSDDCTPISVNDCCVSTRTHASHFHSDATRRSVKEGGHCVKSLETTYSGSIQNEYSNVDCEEDLRASIKGRRLLDSGTINGLRDSILSTDDKGTVFAATRTNGRCNVISRTPAQDLTSKHEEKRKFRVFCITPRPYSADSTYCTQVGSDLSPRPPKPRGCGTVWPANNGAHIGANGATLPFQNSRSITGSLISDEASPTEQTYSTSAPLCDGPVWREPNITKNTANKETVDPNGSSPTPVVDANTSTSALNACVSHTQALTDSLDVEVKAGATHTGRKNKLRASVAGTSYTHSSTQDSSFESLADRGECKNVNEAFDEMGNTQHREFSGDTVKSKHTSTTPSANSEGSEIEARPLSCTIPELVVSDSSLDPGSNFTLQSLEKPLENMHGHHQCTANKVTATEKPLLRPHTSSDSAYSSDSRCTSMDSASDPAVRGEGDFADHDGSLSLLSPPNISLDCKSTSSSSSSPSHSGIAASVTSSDSTLRVMSEYGLQRKLSSSSGSSFRSSLSFEESEDDMLSSDGEIRDHIAAKGRRQSKAQSSWTKIRRMVIWSPFMQSFKKKYPWVQLAGHAGNFQPGEEGCILKKYCAREAHCLSQLSNDDALKPFAPVYHGLVDKEGERYTRMQDLLLAFDCPSVMDCKMGVRTYLEDELVKAKIKPRLRHDMYMKMTEISPKEPTSEEHEAKAVTKPRYMQWREHVSSSSNLAFRIEGIKKGGNDPSKDYKLTKTKDQVKNAFKYFIDDKVEVLGKYIERLKDVRDNAEKSEFFMSHEVIGSSLLFVHDHTGIASAWMIDFGKTSQMPDNKKLSHREEWVEGNREDGYLIGLDNLISIFEEIRSELISRPPNVNAEEKSASQNVTSDQQPLKKEHPIVGWNMSSQSSGDSFDSTPTPLESPSITISEPSFDNESPRKPPLRRQLAATESPDDPPKPSAEGAGTSRNHVINAIKRNADINSAVENSKECDVKNPTETNNNTLLVENDASGTT